MIKISEITKKYGNIEALRRVNLFISKGEISVLLGPNGAGKTTLLSILSTIIYPDSGDILYEDNSIYNNIKEWRNKIGFVPQEYAFYDELSGFENLKLWASLYGETSKVKIKEIAAITNIESFYKRKVNEYSGGMKRRLNIAISLVHSPEILILDEPFTGLDVESKSVVRELINKLKSQGKTIIISTHLLSEAEKIGDKLFIIDEGELKASGTLKELLGLFPEKSIVEIYGDFKGLKAKINELPYKPSEFKNEKLTFELPEDFETVNSVSEKLNLLGFRIKNIQIIPHSLETIFLKLTGKRLTSIDV